ncbi:hypothetical protein RCO28_35650 [Streptomyces sp. LHD-70]|uniref:hypothetical protein n=1 Tax=Streptomyces sp. LHD-70 TaxID=3072140 RepID=UPI00280C9EC8|nr:hypothetical protein [Streptomyces sp. LHD-70]MDQ8707769.1 hypothetical protein [Streptomyces sp. LHD-70]
MHGLKRLGGPRGPKAGSAAALAALGLCLATLVSCSTGGTGTRDEGPARSDQLAQGSPAPSARPGKEHAVDPVRLVREDPQVSKAVKADLKPCAGDSYPVDVSYGNLTGGSRNDVVVNVLTCGDAIGIGAYVYRAKGGAYENVFRTEQPASYAEIDRDGLTVTRQTYEKDDSVALPSGEDITLYEWRDDAFVQTRHWTNRYGSAGGDVRPAPEEN